MNLEVFKSIRFGAVRGTVIKNEAWLVGKDVADKLGYISSNKSILDHVDEDDRFYLNADTQFQNGIELDYRELGQRGGWLINESGLYSLVLSSKLPNAKKFKKWITSEVLPQIRKTGGYIPINDNMSDDEVMARALLIAQNTLVKKDELIKTQRILIEEKNKQIEELEPLAVKWNIFLNEQGLTTIDEFSKSLGIKGFGRNNMYKWFKVNKYLQWDNTPYAQFVNNRQLFVLKNAGYHYEGIRRVDDKKTFLTAKGVEFFLTKFIEEGIIAA